MYLLKLEWFKEPIHESKGSEKVVDYITHDKLSDEILTLLSDGNIIGFYYDNENRLIAEDIWSEIHYTILHDKN